MMKQLFLAVALLLPAFCMSSAQPVTCHITGEVEDKEEKQVVLYELGTDPRVNDFITVNIQNGRFSYDLNTDILRCYEVVLLSEFKRGSMRVANFIVENANVHIVIPRAVDGDDDAFRIESDGKENRMKIKYSTYKDSIYSSYKPKFLRKAVQRDSLDKARQYFKPIVYEVYEKLKCAQGAQRDSLLQLFPQDGFSELGRKTEAEYGALMDDYHVELAKWYENHRCFYGLAEISRGVASNQFSRTQEKYIELYLNHYADYMTGHPYHQKASYGVAASRLQVGKPYIDYEVRGPNGNTVRLSSLYKGKVVFIDLWASWCGPCRRHAKAVVPIYEKYKDKGFQVIGITREKETGRMEAAAKQDGYPCPNFLELNDQHHVWLKNGLNQSGGGGFLIDEKGTILAISPEPDELEKILNEQL